MKEALLTILRDKRTSREAYRDAAEKLATLLAMETADALPQEPVSIETPLGRTNGVRMDAEVTLVPVLRSGLALLPSFLRYFPRAAVGFIGMRRDEKTLEPHNYYINLPPLTKRVIILEPMIATGGSGSASLQILKERGAKQIIFVALIAAEEGLQKIRTHHPDVKLIVAQIDPSLNSAKFIVPGLGDFGDRYFGT